MSLVIDEEFQRGGNFFVRRVGREPVAAAAGQILGDAVRVSGNGDFIHQLGIHAVIQRAGHVGGHVRSAEAHGGVAGLHVVQAIVAGVHHRVAKQAAGQREFLVPFHGRNGFRRVDLGGIGAVIVHHDQIRAKVPGHVGEVPAALVVASRQRETALAGRFVDDLAVFQHLIPGGGQLGRAVLVHEARVDEYLAIAHDGQGVRGVGQAVQLAFFIHVGGKDRLVERAQVDANRLNLRGDVAAPAVLDQLHRLRGGHAEHGGELAAFEHGANRLIIVGEGFAHARVARGVEIALVGFRFALHGRFVGLVGEAAPSPGNAVHRAVFVFSFGDCRRAQGNDHQHCQSPAQNFFHPFFLPIFISESLRKDLRKTRGSHAPRWVCIHHPLRQSEPWFRGRLLSI